MASSDTIIVSKPNGYFSTPSPIHSVNHTMWTYTNTMDPAKVVMVSAIRF